MTVPLLDSIAELMIAPHSPQRREKIFESPNALVETVQRRSFLGHENLKLDMSTGSRE